MNLLDWLNLRLVRPSRVTIAFQSLKLRYIKIFLNFYSEYLFIERCLDNVCRKLGFIIGNSIRPLIIWCYAS